MTRLLVVAIGFLIACAAKNASASQLVELGDELLLPITDNWEVRQGTDYPLKVVSLDGSAQINIHRSVIEPEHLIHNSEDFHLAVDSVVTDVILGLPNAQIVSSTGYGGEGQVSFALEFETSDDYGFSSIRNRMVGMLVRHPDGYQLLFTLWGRASVDAYALYANEIELIQNGLIYRGPAEQSPFADGDTDYDFLWLSLPLILVLIIILRRRRRPVDTTRWVKQWLCGCGQANDLDTAVCIRCSQPRRVGDLS